MKRGSIQLSVNFLVVIIISVVLLSAGIVLLRSFVDITKKTQEQVDEKTEARLYELIDSGYQVAVPFSLQKIERGSDHIFIIGVLNIMDQAEFEIKITFSGGEDDGGRPITGISPEEWFSYDTEPFMLGKDKKATKNVLASVPATISKGTYIFNVEVVRNDGTPETYDKIRKITIIVP